MDRREQAGYAARRPSRAGVASGAFRRASRPRSCSAPPLGGFPKEAPGREQEQRWREPRQDLHRARHLGGVIPWCEPKTCCLGLFQGACPLADAIWPPYHCTSAWLPGSYPTPKRLCYSSLNPTKASPMTVTRASLFGFRLAAAASATAPAAASALSAKVGLTLTGPTPPAEVRNDLRIKSGAPGVRGDSVQPNLAPALVPDLAPAPAQAPAQVLPK